jgi:lysozyme
LLTKHYGRKPVIYGNKNVFNDLMQGQTSAFTIWLGNKETYTEVQLSGKKPWTFWQFTSKKKLEGLASGADDNVFYGSKEMFGKFLAGNDDPLATSGP